MCTKVCPNNLLFLNEEKKASFNTISEFGRDGCWKCQHCMAVCPKGAISILNKNPDDSLLPLSVEITSKAMAVGFGYLEIKYARGVQKDSELKVNVLKFF